MCLSYLQNEKMEQFRPYLEALAAAANVFTIIASGLAIYIFLVNRDKLATAFQLLLNYSFQTTLTELKEKLERLNEYNANDTADLPEIRNILHEISGQIRGNHRLLAESPKLADKLENLALSKKLSEPLKRSIVSEVREQLRNIQLNSVKPNAGENS